MIFFFLLCYAVITWDPDWLDLSQALGSRILRMYWNTRQTDVMGPGATLTHYVVNTALQELD